MKAVLISIQPKWCELIASGKKTIEVRKTRPKIETPFKCYIYCTQTKTIGDIILCKSEENAKLFGYNTVKGINKGFAEKEDIKLKGKVIGEFVCDKIYNLPLTPAFQDYDFTEIYQDNDKSEYFSLRKTCLTQNEIYEYGKGKPLYAWHISDLKIYDKPKELSEFKSVCKTYDMGFELEKCCECKKAMFDEDRAFCGCDRHIERPPQSWCYVEV